MLAGLAPPKELLRLVHDRAAFLNQPYTALADLSASKPIPLVLCHATLVGQWVQVRMGESVVKQVLVVRLRCASGCRLRRRRSVRRAVAIGAVENEVAQGGKLDLDPIFSIARGSALQSNTFYSRDRRQHQLGAKPYSREAGAAKLSCCLFTTESVEKNSARAS
ncbi:hypothetical protein [Actinokineospora iranica]|uniref:hypothetical protein n=1 Tax=Actinokineospora iranica TaxID=1271860 RepID=UPI001587F5DA|nr:hypothetical protein [Actinokineospora iranica]